MDPDDFDPDVLLRADIGRYNIIDIISYHLSRVVHNYVVERGWSGANEHNTR
jgi:hypothetical protein